MLTLKVGSHQISLEERDGKMYQANKEVDFSWEVEKDRLYHISYNSTSYQVLIHRVDLGENLVEIEINGKRATVSLESHMERLLKELGMSSSAEKKLDLLKAPMPGLIKRIYVKEGDEVETGDALLILEAMKMENVIKATGEGTVSEIAVKENASVEKDALLLRFS